MYPEETKVFVCTAERDYPKGRKCNKIYYEKEAAEDCCKPYHCQDCGVETRRYWLRCDPCSEKRKYEKAEKLTKWDGPVYRDGYGHRDGFFYDVGDLLEDCEAEGVNPPEWVFICKEKKHEIDPDQVIESMFDDAYEEAYEDLVDVEELREFIKDWNDKQNIVTYYPDYSRVLLLEGGGSDGTPARH